MKYKFILYLSLLVCVGLLFGLDTHARQAGETGETGETPWNPPGIEQEKAAVKSLELIKQLPLPVLQKLGFESESAVKKSKLGKPLQVHIVGIDKLKEFKKGDDPGEILEDTDNVTYPVYVEETFKSSIQIRKIKQEWRFASLGGMETRYADYTRTIHSSCSPTLPLSYFMVQVPAMHLTFLAYYLDRILYLVPAHKDPDVDFPLYKAVLAEVIFMHLQPLIEEYRREIEPSGAAPSDEGIKISRKYGDISLYLEIGKTYLEPGEVTPLTVTFAGLEADKGDILFRLENKTPGIISMEGGNIRTFIIRVSDIKPDGTFSKTLTLTGNMPGDFDIGIKMYPGLKEHTEKLGGVAGMNYRNEFSQLQKQELINMPKNQYAAYMKNELLKYKTTLDTSMTSEMKEWVDEALEFLDSSNPVLQQWLASFFMNSLVNELTVK